MKRLALHRETLRHLADSDLRQPRGGLGYTYNASVCITACVVCAMSRNCPTGSICGAVVVDAPTTACTSPG